MTRCIFYTATTLDGFLADEQDSLAWLFAQEGGDDPQVVGADEAFDYERFVSGIGAVVLGRTTYDWVMAHHDGPWPYSQPTWLFTHRPVEVGDGIRVVSGDPAEHWTAIAESAGGRDVWMLGGGGLAADFADAGHLDELRLSIAPVTLGAGRPLLPARFALTLLDARPAGPFVQARYAVEGPGRWE